MSTLARGLCSTCGRTAPVRRNGVLREHRRSPAANGICEGSAMPPKERCTQCGGRFSDRACGPTHALIAGELGLVKS